MSLLRGATVSVLIVSLSSQPLSGFKFMFSHYTESWGKRQIPLSCLYCNYCKQLEQASHWLSVAQRLETGKTASLALSRNDKIYPPELLKLTNQTIISHLFNLYKDQSVQTAVAVLQDGLCARQFFWLGAVTSRNLHWLLGNLMVATKLLEVATPGQELGFNSIL